MQVNFNNQDDTQINVMTVYQTVVMHMYQECSDQQPTQVTRPITALEPLELQKYIKECSRKLIQESTGHRSLKSLRVYERSTDGQHEAVSTLLSPAKKTRITLSICQTAVDSQPVAVSGSVNFSFQNLTGCNILYRNQLRSDTLYRLTYSYDFKLKKR